jgi:uncharacterized membrane protein YfcA
MGKRFTEQRIIRRVLTIGDLLSYLLAAFFTLLVTQDSSLISIRLVVESFLPFALVWMVVAPFAGLFRGTIALDLGQLWFVGILVLISTPIGAWLGNVWPGRSYEFTFVLVLTLIAAIVILSWRFAYIRLSRRRAG